jgi:hypothetical protein
MVVLSCRPATGQGMGVRILALALFAAVMTVVRWPAHIIAMAGMLAVVASLTATLAFGIFLENWWRRRDGCSPVIYFDLRRTGFRTRSLLLSMVHSRA